LGELGPHLTECGLGRGLSPCQVSSGSIRRFGNNTPMSHPDRHRQDRQTGQRSDSMGQTVLQTVTPKLRGGQFHLPSLPFLHHLSSFHLPSLHLSFLTPTNFPIPSRSPSPLSFPLESGSLIAARRPGECISSPSVSGQSLAAKRILVHCRQTFASA